MFSGEFPRNCWYVAGRSEDFGREMRALRLFGDEIVFFRKGDGSPVALEDACPHRKLPLSKGTLSGDAVVCGYHGLTFDGTGGCVAAPTQEGAIPKRARVHSYPLLERYGFVWIWPGDAAAADVARAQGRAWVAAARLPLDSAEARLAFMATHPVHRRLA